MRIESARISYPKDLDQRGSVVTDVEKPERNATDVADTGSLSMQSIRPGNPLLSEVTTITTGRLLRGSVSSQSVYEWLSMFTQQ